MSADLDPEHEALLLKQLEARRSQQAKLRITDTERRRQLKQVRLLKRELKDQLRQAKKNVPLKLRSKVNWSDIK